MRTALLALLLVPAVALAQEKPQLIPGFDHKAMIDGHVKLIVAGKSEEAVEYLAKRFRNPNIPAAVSEDFQKKFAAIFALLGKYDGHEIIGHRKLSSRLYALYAPVFFEKGNMYFSYIVEKSGDEWKIHTFRIWDKIEEWEKVVPFVPADELNKSPKAE